jgi:hypothetical protein
MRMLAIVSMGLAMTGCARPADRPATPAASAMCDSTRIEGAIGQTFTPALGDTWRTKAGARAVRVIRPGTAVTMDYRPDRLNVTLDEAGRVTALRCG